MNLLALLVSLAVPLSPTPFAPPVVPETLLVTGDWLQSHLDDPRVVVLSVVHGMDRDSNDQRIPGARDVDYMSIIRTVDSVPTELPPVERLVELFQSLGVGDDTRVVIYGEPLMAARAFFTLEYLGHSRVSLLAGGLDQWKKDGRPVTRTRPTVREARLTAHPRPEIVATADWVRSVAGKPHVTLLDTRTPEEYRGEGDRRGIPSVGHIASARLIQWPMFLNDRESLSLKPRADLEALYLERGAAPGDTVVVYCTVGMRASLSYFVSRYLGHPTRFYDGSYIDWSRRNYPLKKTDEP